MSELPPGFQAGSSSLILLNEGRRRGKPTKHDLQLLNYLVMMVDKLR